MTQFMETHNKWKFMLVWDINRDEGNYLMEVIPYGNGRVMTCYAAFIYHRYDLSHVTYFKKRILVLRIIHLCFPSKVWDVQMKTLLSSACEVTSN